MKTKIYINRHVIASNKKHGRNDPPITVADYKSRCRTHEVEIMGNSRVVYQPDKPLSCGATVWIETEAPVLISRPEEDDE